MNEAKSAKAFNLTTAILYTVPAGFYALIGIILLLGMTFTGAALDTFGLYRGLGGAVMGAFLIVFVVILAVIAAYLVPAIIGYSYNGKLNRANNYGDYLEILNKQSKFLLIYSSIMEGLAVLGIIGNIVGLIDGSEDDVSSTVFGIVFLLVFPALRLTFSAIANTTASRLIQACTPEMAQMRVNLPLNEQAPAQMQYQPQQMQYQPQQVQYAQPGQAQYTQPLQQQFDPLTGQPVQMQYQPQQVQYAQPGQAQYTQPLQQQFDPMTGQPVHMQYQPQQVQYVQSQQGQYIQPQQAQYQQPQYTQPQHTQYTQPVQSQCDPVAGQVEQPVQPQ